VIIPAYNEENNIEEVLFRTNKTMETTGIPYEIIVVDDGSKDKTRFLAERQKVTVIRNGTNRGKGHALKLGLLHAIGKIIITIDADGSHEPEEIPRLLKPLLCGADVVLGSRFLGLRERDSVSMLHAFGNRLFNLLILISTRKRVTDSQSGFRAFRKKVIEEIPLASEGYDIETEFLVKALKSDYLVLEEPVTCKKRKDGCSHLNPLHDGFKIFKNIIQTRPNL
jgi:glycosyltransferase involved in cell wall biosynthesis